MKRDKLYTIWLSCFLCKVGDDSFFHYPIRLQGGGNKSICVGSRTSIRSFSILGCWEKYKSESYNPSIIIGNDCSFGEFNHITAINEIVIGNGLLTGRFVFIGDNSHGELSWEDSVIPPAQRHLKSKGRIIIGNNVWLGDKVSILGGVTIGDNVIVGANSVVTKSVPSNSIVAGVPAKIVKQLNNRYE